MPKINTINDFAAAAQTALAAAYPECRIESINVTKNNSVHLTGLTIKPQNNKVTPTLYMEPYFNMFKSGQPLAAVINQIINSCMDALSCTNAGIDVDGITDFAHVKDKICYKLIVKDKNSEFLSAVPHRDYLDLAVVYYLHLSITDNGLATVTVTNSLAQMWGIDEEALFALASSNTPRLCRGIVLTLDNVLGSSQILKTKPYAEFDFTCSETDILPMYVATNASKTYGAAVVLYDSLLETVAARLGSFYALPSSVHEFMFVPDTFGNSEDIKQMVRDINASEVQPDEVLSDNIYHYDVTTHELTVIL